MRHPLHRVLRLRSLLEDLSQLELEQRGAEVRRLEAAAEQEQTKARAARRDGLQRLTAGQMEWMLDVADAEILAWKGARLRSLAESRRPEVETARAALLERRLERRQVEALLTEAAEAEAMDEARREQQGVDDWFQSRTAREKPIAERDPHCP